MEKPKTWFDNYIKEDRTFSFQVRKKQKELAFETIPLKTYLYIYIAKAADHLLRVATHQTLARYNLISSLINPFGSLMSII